MDFIQRRHRCGYHAQFTVKRTQDARVGSHTDGKIAAFDSDDFLPGKASKPSKFGLSEPTVEATLPKLRS